MKQATLLITVFLLTRFAFAQTEDVWVRFYDSTTDLSGYKDLQGNIKIPAKFGGFTNANTFHNIIAVNETIDSSYRQYYLLKNGKKVGQDSVYVFDFTFDCECEGKILFKDRKKDRVGFFDKNGVPIIPAVYNSASSFRNGIAVAHKNARRKCWEKEGDTTNCEHLGWEGGETVLINEKNEILADSLTIDLSSINWYSKRINYPLVDTSIYINIKGKSSFTYSFISYDKEFKNWFNEDFIPSLNNNNTLQNLLFDKVTYWSPKDGWISLEKKAFVKTFPAALTKKRFEASKWKEISMSQELFNELIFDKDIYKKYLNSCGEHDKEKYPLYSVMLSYSKKRNKALAEDAAVKVAGDYEVNYQESFEFLKTESGYKLLSVSLKK